MIASLIAWLHKQPEGFGAALHGTRFDAPGSPPHARLSNQNQ
jgi:hypothetical protein